MFLSLIPAKFLKTSNILYYVILMKLYISQDWSGEQLYGIALSDKEFAILLHQKLEYVIVMSSVCNTLLQSSKNC